MLIIKLIVILFVSHISNCNGSSNYCDICANHTMCKYNKPGPSKACIGYDMTSLITKQNVEDILNRVNEKRNFVAMGLSKNLPKAANMKKIVWSQELAIFAQRWADQCSSEASSIDECRDLESMAVGQNVASVMGPSPGLSVKAFVDIWFMQVLDYNGSISYYNRSQDSNTVFFTQLIWANTEIMGCAKVKYYLSKKRSNIEKVVCNFAPKGNIDGKPVYAIGLPSTQCPHQMKPDVNYAGLCSNDTIQGTSLTTADSPVTSLLRIIDLSDYAVSNNTDPNQNLNINKEHFNDRYQKIRHIFNNEDKPDLSLFHDAEEKFKEFILKYTKDSSFYDYVHNMDNNNQTHVTSQKIFFPSSIFRQDGYTKPPLINGYGRTRSCTRTLHTENSYKKSVIPIVINRCTRKRERDWNKGNKVFSVLQGSTRCNCNSDCQNPADSYLGNLIMGNRRRKVLPTMKPDLHISLTKPDIYDLYNNYKTHSAQLRYMYLPRLTQPEYKNYENIQKSLLSSHSQYGVSYKHENTEPRYWFNKDKRRKRTQDIATNKPFWQVDDYKLNDMPLLKSLRFTTLALRRHKTNRQKISTTPPKTTKQPKEITIKPNPGKNSSEKYLSFEELLHLRKGTDGKHFQARRKQNKVEDGRRDAETTPPQFTVETEFQHVKYCTRKLTCTWTAIFNFAQDGSNSTGNGGSGGGGGKGAYAIGGGTKTPPGYVEGCTRTWTCTRPNFEKNKGPTSAVTKTPTTVDEDYCEKRALERRNLDENDYNLFETPSLPNEDNIPISFTTEPMPPSYESSTIMQTDSTEICPCNDESSRKRRHVDTYDLRSKSIIDSELSYGDLFYLVVQKIINKAKTEKCLNDKCICSKTTTNNNDTNILVIVVYLLLFIKLIA